MPKRTLVVVGRAVIEREGRVLLIRRAKHDPWAAGQWEFPGGKIDRGTDFKANLSRELREEIGLKAKIGKPFLLYERPIANGKYAGRRYIALYCRAEIRSSAKTPTLGEEHDALRWINPSCLPRNISLAPGTKEALARYLKIKSSA